MTSELIISLDAMGGDHAPDIVIEGAGIARERVPNLQFIIYGDEIFVGHSPKNMMTLKNLIDFDNF